MRAALLLLLAGCGPGKVGLDGPGDSPADTAALPGGRPANPTCLAPDRPASDAPVALNRAWPSLTLTNPVWIGQAPGDAARFYAIEQAGRLVWWEGADEAPTATVALDLVALVSTETINEDGFLGFAFHPDFAVNGDAFVNYTAGSSARGDLHTVVARVHSDDGGLSFAVGETLLEVDQPWSNHNGGHLLFGPDGLLYLGLGDGGAGGDPEGNGQDPYALLGKLLRIDVDHRDAGLPYAIPADNPFADGESGAPEVYAWGLRNPWRFSFDRATGELWVGDVGQNRWEEIDRVELGGNYGWNVMEGFHCYPEDRECDPTGLVPPVVELEHDGAKSILGGHVYRGSAIPGLVGTYVFADSYVPRLYTVAWDEVTGAASPVPLLDAAGLVPASFGEDAAGELYLVDWQGGGVWRLDPAGEAAPDTFPDRLSETGCVDPADPRSPAPGLVPYGVNVPLWSDGADKERWFAIPDGTTLSVRADGTLEFPVGSVLMKQFSLGGRPVETRLLVRHEDGYWAGYSYAWDEAGTDAILLAAGATVEVGGQTWSVPGRPECLECHTEVAGRVLGPRLEQLNGAYTYPSGVVANQLEVLDAAGFFAAPLGDVGALGAWPAAGSGDPTGEARALLAANCAMCHVPGGTGGGPMDLRYETPLAEMAACDEPPLNGELGVIDARIVAPGAPERSLVPIRMGRLDVHRMPPLGTAVVDEVGVAAVEAWIAGLEGCD